MGSSLNGGVPLHVLIWKLECASGKVTTVWLNNTHPITWKTQSHVNHIPCLTWGVNQKFHVWGNITILGLPQLWVNTILSKVAPFVVYMYGRMTCDTVWISTVSSNCHPFNFIFIFYYDCIKEVSFWPDLANPHTQKVNWQQTGHKFCTNLPHVKASVKVHQHVTYNMPRMLQTSLVIHNLPSWMWIPSKVCELLKRLLHERIFKVFCKSQKLFLQGQNNLMQILCSVRSAMSLATGIAEHTQNKHTSTLHKNVTFCYSDSHHTISQLINSAVPCGTQLRYV
jgi:hypothetical protein